MEKQRTIRMLALATVFVAVLGLTVAFAAMSRTLNINGTAEVDNSKWDVHFATNEDGSINMDEWENSLLTETGNAKLTKLPVISSTTVNDFEVTLTKPDDEVKLGFVIKNDGTMNAKLSDIEIKEPVCTSLTNPADAQIVCNNLKYQVTDFDDNLYDENKKGAVIGKNGGTDYLFLTIEYAGNELPSDDVNISNLGVTLVYTQD